MLLILYAISELGLSVLITKFLPQKIYPFEIYVIGHKTAVTSDD